MNVVQEFKINQDDSIKILIPDIEDKYNYYYEPTEKLHVFDQLAVVFQHKDNSIELAKDTMDSIFVTFEFALEKVLSGNNNLPEKYNAGDIGRIYNIDIETENENYFDSAEFSLWGNKDNSVWLYRKNNTIYLEISPKYPWLYWDPEEPTPTLSFQDFMKSYKPIALFEIDNNTIRTWLQQCSNIMEIADRPSGYEYYEKNDLH